MKKLMVVSLLALASGAALADGVVKWEAVKTKPELVPSALAALKEVKDEAKARIVVALTPHAERADVKDALLAALSDESEIVRVVALRAAPLAKDPRALPVVFGLCSAQGEDGRCANLAMAALATEGADDFLFGQMKQAGAACVKAIGLLAARGSPGLIARLCDAGLYEEKGVSQAAAGALRTCLQQAQFADALAFVFGPLAADQRGPLVAALGSVAQQLPDEARVVREIGACVAEAKPEARADVLGLLAGFQTAEARNILTAQLKGADVELRKAIVRTFAKWSSSLAIAPLVDLAVNDADNSVKVLAFRSALTLMDKPKVVDADEKFMRLRMLAETVERKEEQKLIYTALKGLSTPAAAAYRKAFEEKHGVQDTEVLVAAINIGGKEAGAFKADSRIAGGQVYAVEHPIDLSGAADTAPEAVYQSSRFQNMSCNLDNLKPNAPHVLRLHFAELYHQEPGKRVCDVIVNGVKVVENFDIVEQAGKAHKAITVTRNVMSNADGKIAVEFKTVVDHVLVNGLELLEEVAHGAPAVLTPASRIRVLILSGANNHDWKSTTEALKTVFAADPRFAVSVTETPWGMKPADLAGYDVLLSNWNTFGKKEDEIKKFEWDAEMKAAFMKWMKDGGGFFVLHSGSCIFYDWDEYQKLTAGAWGDGTFHPHNQKFTLNIVDKEHPVTKGMADFEVFDEPWQKITNPNPNRHVLISGVVSKENKGSGEPEPFAFVTEAGKGRCFTLMLGHDAQMILNSPDCRKLILRGTAWAARRE